MEGMENKSKQELLNELRNLTRKLDETQNRLRQLEQSAADWKYTDLIIAHSPAILFRRLASPDLSKRKMVYVSPNISRFGYTAEDFISNRVMFRQLLYPEDTERTAREIDEFVARGIENYSQTYRIVTRSGEVRWVEDHTSVIDDPETGIRYHQGILTDVHQRKMVEEQLRKSEEKYRRIVETAGEGFLFMDTGLRIIDVNQAFCRMIVYTREEIIGRNLLDLVIEKYRPFLAANREDLLNRNYYQFECGLISDTGSAVPVLIHGNSLFDDGGVLIGNIAFVTNMAEHKKALVLAGEFQKTMLPQEAPVINGLDVSGKNISCDEIGGDYFDFLIRPEAPERRLTVVVGDVSGHGVDSALLMTTARAFLRMRNSRPGAPGDIVADMNRHLSEDIYETGKFMTLFYLTVDLDKKRLEWVRAGHEPAWLYDPREDSFLELKGPGIALGLDEEYAYPSNHKDDLKAGQLLIVGTDGIWESHNKAGEMFGKKRFQDTVRRHAASGAEAIIDAVLNDHRLFTQDARPEDDITLVIVKITK